MTPQVTLAGILTDLENNPVAGAEVSSLEGVSTVATTAANGYYAVRVPVGEAVTVLFTLPGHPRSLAQTVVPHIDVTDFDAYMATSDQYALIESVAPRPAGSGVILVSALTTPGCSVVGARLGSEPASGTVVYAEPDRQPNPSYTSMQPGAPGGYIVGAVGAVTPTIADIPPPCVALPYPASPSAVVTFQGPTIVEDGGFSAAYLFVNE